MRVLLEKDGPYIAVITIDNQKKLNAMSREMMQLLGNFWDELSQDETRCIIITGSGQRAFCVGADISGDLEATPELSKVVNHALLKTDIFKKPIIELHISNIYKREEFRHKSLISEIVTGGIFGLGTDGYILAIIAIEKILRNEN